MLNMKKPTRGGARKGAGRKSKGRVRMCAYILPQVHQGLLNDATTTNTSVGAVIETLYNQSKQG